MVTSSSLLDFDGLSILLVVTSTQVVLNCHVRYRTTKYVSSFCVALSMQDRIVPRSDVCTHRSVMAQKVARDSERNLASAELPRTTRGQAGISRKQLRTIDERDYETRFPMFHIGM